MQDYYIERMYLRGYRGEVPALRCRYIILGIPYVLSEITPVKRKSPIRDGKI